MVRVGSRTQTRLTGPITADEETHVIRHMPPELEARMHELARRHNQGQLPHDELAEFDALVRQAEELTLENARALLRHRDAAAYAAALAEEQRILRREATGRQRQHRPQTC